MTAWDILKITYSKKTQVAIAFHRLAGHTLDFGRYDTFNPIDDEKGYSCSDIHCRECETFLGVRKRLLRKAYS